MTDFNYDYCINLWNNVQDKKFLPGIYYDAHTLEFKACIFPFKVGMLKYVPKTNKPITIHDNYHCIFFKNRPSLAVFNMNLKNLIVYIKQQNIEHDFI